MYKKKGKESFVIKYIVSMMEQKKNYFHKQKIKFFSDVFLFIKLKFTYQNLFCTREKKIK